MPSIFVITGPSGVGKTTVARELAKHRLSLRKVITCTTRAPRPGEANDVDYHFLDLAAFGRLIESGGMFEFGYHYGNLYGSRTADVESLTAQGYDVLFVVDVDGAVSIRRDHPEAVVIFLDAESTSELIARMEARDHGTTAGRADRVAAIERERAYGTTCDHRVVNTEGQLDITVATIDRIMENR